MKIDKKLIKYCSICKSSEPAESIAKRDKLCEDLDTTMMTQEEISTAVDAIKEVNAWKGTPGYKVYGDDSSEWTHEHICTTCMNRIILGVGIIKANEKANLTGVTI